MSITLRQNLDRPLTIQEMDANFSELSGSIAAISSSVVAGEYIETIVNITPTETTYSDDRPLVASGVLAMGSSPIELLPTPSVGTYHGVAYYDFEFDGDLYDTLDFNHFLRIDQANIPSAGINRSLIIYISGGITTTQKYIRVYPGTGLLETVTQSLYIQPYNMIADGKITLKMAKATSPFNANPTGGGGTLRVKIYHKTITFGV